MEFTATETLRPDLIEKSLNSYKENLIGFEFDILYLNIDSIGPSNPIEVVEICKKFFKEVRYTIPIKPNFTRAIINTWSRVKGEYFFHMEMDWELTSPVYFEELKEILYQSELRKEVWLRHRFIKSKCKLCNDSSDCRFCLCAGLIKTNWAKDIIANLDINFNPENQIRTMDTQSCFCGYPLDRKEIMLDLGRDWMIKNKLQRKQNNGNWTEWEEKKIKPIL